MSGDQDHRQDEAEADVPIPEPVVFDPASPPAELPPLPPGMRWELSISAETEVIRADGTTER